jgi:chromosome partitioning protein
MRRISFINEKGGTAKTTLAVNVAAYLADAKGLKVLLVDLDTQGHAGKSLGLDVRTLSPNVFHWLVDDAVRLSQVAYPSAVPRLAVVPAYKEMSDFPLQVAQDPRRVHRLADKLTQEALAYDVVVMDGPPSLGLTTLNILAASTDVVIPVALTYLALDGCAEVAQTVEKVAREHGRQGLHVTRVVPTLYRKTALAEAVRAKLGAYFEGRVTVPLGINVKIDEAQSHGKTVFEYAPKSKGAQMLAAIAEEIYEAAAEDAAAPRVA